MIREIREIQELPDPTGPFSQAVVADVGQLVFVSGQVAHDRDGMLVGGADAGAQADRCLQCIDAALRAVGLARTDVAKITIYLTNINDRAAVSEARSQFFQSHRPAATLVEVSALAAPGLIVEIDAIAVAGT